MSPSEGQASSTGSSKNSANSDFASPAPSSATSKGSGTTNSVISTEDDLTCMWQSCNQTFATPETLYGHVCDHHVGRKSTNNLNLTCGWGSCRITTAKRDHITSHVRTHVPLSPHKCEFCGKPFKRPQDLKKHVRTHASDVVSVQGQQSQENTEYRPQATQRTLPSSIWPHRLIPISGFPNDSSGSGFHGLKGQMCDDVSTNAQPRGHLGGDYGPHPSTASANQSSMSAPRTEHFGYSAAPSYNFFGYVQRRQIDPSPYTEVGRSLLPLYGSILVPNGPTPAEAQYVPQPAREVVQSPARNPLLLGQMQDTIYENADSATTTVKKFGNHHACPWAPILLRSSSLRTPVAAESCPNMSAPLFRVSSTGTLGKAPSSISRSNIQPGGQTGQITTTTQPPIITAGPVEGTVYMGHENLWLEYGHSQDHTTANEAPRKRS